MWRSEKTVRKFLNNLCNRYRYLSKDVIAHADVSDPRLKKGFESDSVFYDKYVSLIELMENFEVVHNDYDLELTETTMEVTETLESESIWN